MTFSGSSSQAFSQTLIEFSLPAGDYFFRVSGVTISANAYLYIRDIDNAQTLAECNNSKVGTNISFTLSATTNLRFYIVYGNSGLSITGTAYCMVCKSTVTDTTFAPYSNLCPITGHTGANVWRTGKNLYSSKFSDYTKPYDYYVCPIDLKVGTVYSISATLTGTAVSGCIIGLAKHGTRYADFGSFDTLVTATGAISSYIPKYFTVTTDWDDPKLIVYCSGEEQFNQLFENYNIQLEIGSSFTAYEPYKGNVYPISWQTEAGTVYGGSLDVTTGVLKVDTAVYTLNGTTNAMNAMSDSGSYKFFSKTNFIVPGYNTTASNDPKTLWCDTFNAKGSGAVGNTFISGGYFRICADPSLASVEAFNTWLESNNVTFIYKLATAIEYTLTPTEIRTLLGQNNLWADVGQISEVTYPCDTKLYINKVIASAVASL